MRVLRSTCTRESSTITFVALLVTLALAVVAMPASAASREPIGPSINVLLGTPTTFPSGAPFHIGHGWQLSSDGDALGQYRFALQVDGTYRTEDFISRTVTSGNPDLLNRFWVFNFPSGLSVGPHTFVGHWLARCSVTSGPCSNPNAVVDADVRTLTVTFTP